MEQMSLPLRSDPASGAIVGTIVLFTVLMLPSSLLLLLVALFVISIARSFRAHPRPTEDKEFAARFRQLEQSILDTNARSERQALTPRRGRRSP